MLLFIKADVLNIELTVIKKLISKLKTIKDIKNFNSYWLWSTENVNIQNIIFYSMVMVDSNQIQTMIFFNFTINDR